MGPASLYKRHVLLVAEAAADDDDEVQQHTETAKTKGEKPQQAGADLSDIEPVNPEITQQEAEQCRHPAFSVRIEGVVHAVGIHAIVVDVDGLHEWLRLGLGMCGGGTRFVDDLFHVSLAIHPSVDFHEAFGAEELSTVNTGSLGGSTRVHGAIQLRLLGILAGGIVRAGLCIRSGLLVRSRLLVWTGLIICPGLLIRSGLRLRSGLRIRPGLLV